MPPVQKHRWKRDRYDVRLTLLRTEALQELSETHSHRTVVTLVIVVLVLINTLYVAAEFSAVSAYLPRWARNMIDTDDLVQETVVSTLKHIDVFDSYAARAGRRYDNKS